MPSEPKFIATIALSFVYKKASGSIRLSIQPSNAWLCSETFIRCRPRNYPLPPGPKPLPIIGNVLDLPRSREFATYHKWSKMYGDVVHAQAFGQHIVILNSVQAAMVHDPLL